MSASVELNCRCFVGQYGSGRGPFRIGVLIVWLFETDNYDFATDELLGEINDQAMDRQIRSDSRFDDRIVVRDF